MSEMRTYECWVYDSGCRADMVSKPEAEAVLAAQDKVIADKDKAIRHHKFKRCLKNAESCLHKSWFYYEKHYESSARKMWKWRQRWLKLAKQFNSTAQ